MACGRRPGCSSASPVPVLPRGGGAHPAAGPELGRALAGHRAFRRADVHRSLAPVDRPADRCVGSFGVMSRKVTSRQSHFPRHDPFALIWTFPPCSMPPPPTIGGRFGPRWGWDAWPWRCSWPKWPFRAGRKLVPNLALIGQAAALAAMICQAHSLAPGRSLRRPAAPGPDGRGDALLPSNFIAAGLPFGQVQSGPFRDAPG